MKQLAITFLYCISIASCTNDIELNYEVKEHRLIIDCTFTNDEPLTVYVSTNSFILDTISSSINHASVILFENEQCKDTLQNVGNGQYCSKYIPQQGNCYSLVVKADGYDSVTARDTLPSLGFDLTNIYFTPKVLTQDGIRFDLLSFDIYDFKETSDCFELIFLNNGTINDKHPYVDLFYISNPIISLKSWDAPYTKTILFADGSFNKKNAHFDIYVHNNGKCPIIKLRKVSYSYFEFKKSLYVHLYNQLTERDDIDGFFKGDPVEIYSNIEKGYGIFVGFTEIIK